MGVKRRDHMKEITKEALLEALKLRDTGDVRRSGNVNSKTWI